jgi:hypothetical protein
MIEALGFSLAMAGFALLTWERMWSGLILSLIGDVTLIVYGILTKQYWLMGANVVYSIIILIGIFRLIAKKVDI